MNICCVLDFPANNIVKFLVGFTNKGTEDFIVESLDASFRYPQDYQFYIQNFTALPLNTVVPPQKQATFEYSFIPAEPMGGRPFGLVINLNYRDVNVSLLLSLLFSCLSMWRCQKELCSQVTASPGSECLPGFWAAWRLHVSGYVCAYTPCSGRVSLALLTAAEAGMP